MAKFKFKSNKKHRFNFIKNDNDITNYELINQLHCELFFNKKAIIEGCKKILDYQENYVKIGLKKGNIGFIGKDFIITDFEDEKITICGNIDSIEFCV
ncbi:MAG: YabP/YqfC family sporulation protein [Clostridia bacterium]|nr:YabP/YqfC family sporulation protein [Clostridia bacterium]